jgi:hypothetical protein
LYGQYVFIEWITIENVRKMNKRLKEITTLVLLGVEVDFEDFL